MDYIISSAYDGKRRKLFSKTCKICNKIFYIPKHRWDGSFYCSKECSGIDSRTQIQQQCAYCHTDFLIKPSSLVKSKSGLHFCKRECKDTAQRIASGFTILQPDHYGNLDPDGAYNYRQRAFKEYGKICAQCGYDIDDRMLDVDHIIGRKISHKIADLQVLCLWCHALKTRKVPIHNWTGDIHGSHAQDEANSLCAIPKP